MTNLLGGQQLDVAKLFNDAIPYSFVYGIIVIAFSYFVGIPLGIIAAIKSKKMLGKAVNSLSLFIYSIPSVIIIMIIFVIPVGFFHQSSLFASDSFFPKF
jgi:ABC-type dipeptide/oligopeptide/nickel transport system permease component